MLVSPLRLSLLKPASGFVGTVGSKGKEGEPKEEPYGNANGYQTDVTQGLRISIMMAAPTGSVLIRTTVQLEPS
jgi:hypothetical protein